MKNILACPICNSPLHLDKLDCEKCKNTWEKKDGVPSFISREMYASDKEEN